MANLVAEGFATYGTGTVYNVNTSDRSVVANNMLSGAWAAVPQHLGVELISGTGNVAYPDCALGYLPWKQNPTDYYISCFTAQQSTVSATPFRRVLPSTVNVAIASFYYAIGALPAQTVEIVRFCDINLIARLRVQLLTSGALQISDLNGTVIATTGSPVVVAESEAHFEIEYDTVLGNVTVAVQGQTVISVAGTAPTGNQIAQFEFIPPLTYNFGISHNYPLQYIGNLILRDNSGTINKGIVGDRRVATLLLGSDDPAHQGWTPRPLEDISTGICFFPQSGYVQITNAADNIGNKDFTIESLVRINTLPQPNAYQHIMGSWNSHGTGSGAAYRLILACDAGGKYSLQWQTTTDGTINTIVTVATIPWTPILGRWYALAVSRSTGQLGIFIDGRLQGGFTADSLTYPATITSGQTLGADRDGSFYQPSNPFSGWMDEFRLTVGAGRYTANYTPQTAPWPRGVADTYWTDVQALVGFDLGSFKDESSYSTIVTVGAPYISGVTSPTIQTPNDLGGGYKVLDKLVPQDNSFLEAALVAATGQLTFTAQPANGNTVTLGTKNGTTAAVYTFVTTLSGAAFEVLIGASLAATIQNLTDAINLSGTIGTQYGTGTTANFNASAAVTAGNAIAVTALAAGTVGNSIATTATGAAATWGATTLTGGVDAPAYSQFGFNLLPPGVTAVDSITLVQRAWKSDAGDAQVQASIVGGGGGVQNGATRFVGTLPTYLYDTFEHDPDNTANPLTPQVVAQMKMRINRTV